MIRLNALVERVRNGRPYMAVIGEAVPTKGGEGLAVTLRELPEPDAAGERRFLLLSPKPITARDLIDDDFPPGL
ncbi:MAG: hypothetical protein WC869_11810 [Phycisphaerae bacterium]|jgi:hypothetical protein